MPRTRLKSQRQHNYNQLSTSTIIAFPKMMFLKTAFIAAFIPALSFASECADNLSFTFNMDSNNFVQTCSWITRNEDRTVFRRNQYCNRGEIKGACPVSCDMCPCEDDLSFQFTSEFSGATVNCSWLVAKNDSKRKADYCPVQEIGSACVNTCDFCTGEGGTLTPSGVPSTSPSAASSTPTISMTPTDRSPTSNPSAPPTINGSMRPSTSPSKAPTELPSVVPTMSPIVGCADDPIFTFKLDSGPEKKCDWLLKNKRKQKVRFNKYCDRGHVKTACKNSCQYCTCEDVPGSSFTLKNGRTQTCDWFTTNDNNSIRRQYIYCFEEDNKLAASEIGNKCVESCGFCNGFSAVENLFLKI